MQNAKIFRIMFSSIQNAKFIALMRFFWVFFTLEDKIQNGEWLPFCQKNCMMFSSILQNDELKPKIFEIREELNTP